MSPANVIEQWTQEEQAVRARLRPPGAPRPTLRPYNPMGTVHGGWFATLLDSAEGRIVGPDGKLYAHATTTCLVFDWPADARG